MIAPTPNFQQFNQVLVKFQHVQSPNAAVIFNRLVNSFFILSNAMVKNGLFGAIPQLDIKIVNFACLQLHIIKREIRNIMLLIRERNRDLGHNRDLIHNASLRSIIMFPFSVFLTKRPSSDRGTRVSNL